MLQFDLKNLSVVRIPNRFGKFGNPVRFGRPLVVSTNIIADDVVGGDGMIHMIHSYIRDILEVGLVEVLPDDRRVEVLRPDDLQQVEEELRQDVDHWHGVNEVQDWLHDEDKHNH